LKPKESIRLHIQTSNQGSYESIASVLKKQVNASELLFTKEPVSNTVVVAIESEKFFLESEKEINTGQLKEDLLKDLDYQQKFLDSVNKKLANERFVQNAKPEVVDIERKKKADAEARIKAIEESLQALG
jgi:valyl-tRNA synthetase